jgi:spermidine synthase
LGLAIHTILDGLVFEFLFKSGLEPILKFIFTGNEHAIVSQIKLADSNFFFIYIAIFFVFLGFYLIYQNNKIIFSKNYYLSNKENVFVNLKKKEIYLCIILAAGFSLFLELSIIRIHSSFIHFFSFFKNISLISCFLGLGIGYALKNYKIYSINWIFPLLTIQIIVLFLLNQTPVSTMLVNPIAEQFAMGQDTARSISHLFIIYSFILFIYLFNALCFVPVGHMISRLMAPIEGLTAYGLNLIGSLLGIFLFLILSFLWFPPTIWILISYLLFIIINAKNKNKNLISGLCVILVVTLLSSFVKDKKQTIYSPYQNISIEQLTTPLNPIIIQTSHLFYQALLNLSEDLYFERKDRVKGNIFGYHVDVEHEREFYNLPHLISPILPKKIMIVGSGAGNDVAAANRFNINDIDAVEIDPVIAELGKQYHPELPYNNINVNLFIDDARSFIKNNQAQYDTIIYGLLDSQTNLSSKGGIRLDSYVYTIEAFEEAKKVLKNDGIMCLSFFVQTPELGFKLLKMLEKVFGHKPLVLKSELNDRYVFIAKKNIESKLNIDDLKYFKKTEVFDKIHVYDVDLSTDDWPFIYMPYKVYPLTYLFIVILLVVSSIIFLNRIIKVKKNNFSFICFFLGAGFMLIETKCITEMAKIYGSTWMVTSIVIGVVLVMAFIANLLVIKKIKLKCFTSVFTFNDFTIIRIFEFCARF